MTDKALSAKHQRVYDLLYGPDADAQTMQRERAAAGASGVALGEVSDDAYQQALGNIQWGEEPSGHLVTDYEPSQIEESKGE